VTRPAALLLPCLLYAAGDGYADTLTVVARAADVRVEPAVDGELRLPDLEIDTRIVAECSDGRPPVSLSVSSADSIRPIATNTNGADGRWQFLFSLPASQVPPVLAHDFCLDDAAAVLPDTLRKSAFLSLRANMRCAASGEEHLTSATALVDLRLVCHRSERAAPDQDSSE
jgi:hypothetical protein